MIFEVASFTSSVRTMLMFLMMARTVTVFGQQSSSLDFSVDRIRQHCNGSLTTEQYEELVELSDLSTFESYLEAPNRTRRVAEIFGEAGDRRGIFASMYVATTAESTRSTQAGVYDNQYLAEQLVYGFAKRYLGPLHNYLTGVDRSAQEPKWAVYFDLTAECDNSPLYVLATGVNIHLTSDLAWTLIEINATDSFEADFMYFGEILHKKALVESYALIEAQQGFDPSPLFNVFFLGPLLDAILGDGATSLFLFQFVRSGAFTDFQRIRDNPKGSWLYGSVDRRWWFRQLLLQIVPF